jgi:hypothetical protein
MRGEFVEQYSLCEQTRSAWLRQFRADKSNEERGVTVVGFAKTRTALPGGGRRLGVVLDRESAMDLGFTLVRGS